jgi:hypothetical protein
VYAASLPIAKSARVVLIRFAQPPWPGKRGKIKVKSEAPGRVTHSVRLSRLNTLAVAGQLSIRSILTISLIGPVASLALLLCRWVYLRREEPGFALELTNFGVVLLPFAFSILFAFVPDRGTRRWRTLIIAVGIGFSSLLWEQQRLAVQASKREQQKAIDTAIANANKHSDAQFSAVRGDFENVTKRLKGRLSELSAQVAKSGTDLVGATATVGRGPAKDAQLQFAFWSDSLPFPTSKTVPLGPDNTLSVDFTVTNISDAPATAVEIWVQLCNECAFTKEPEGFDEPGGTDDLIRHKQLAQLNPGESVAKVTIDIKTTKTFDVVPLAFRYSCATCGSVGPTQVLSVLTH